MDVPGYVSSDDSDTSYTIGASRDATAFSDDDEEYDDEIDTSKDPQTFSPLWNHNTCVLSKEHGEILIGLRTKQRVFLSGIFALQIVKGGITYNNVHYNASRKIRILWHPLCSAIPPIQSSYYAGWDNTTYISPKYKEKVTQEYNEFECVIKVSNTRNGDILRLKELFTDMRYLWKAEPDSVGTNTTYQILVPNVDPFVPLLISNDWRKTVDTLTTEHKNSTLDMRVMVIGGKNSGKSTLLRILRENFQTSESDSASELFYLDLDPGQPEFSDPECISLVRIENTDNNYGQHLCQAFHQTIKQFYVGSPSPQDVPEDYLAYIDTLITTIEEENYIGTTIVNMPGWIKGFGMHVTNQIISKFRPTNIVMLESKSSIQHLNEIVIPKTFCSNLREEYSTTISRVPANAQIAEKYNQLTFHASQLRTYRTLAFFHSLTREQRSSTYLIEPLVSTAPSQIAFGKNSPVLGLLLPEEFRNIEPQDIRHALEGTIIAIEKLPETQINEEDISTRGSFQLVKQRPKNSQYITLGLIHSIDENNKIINLYVPDHRLKHLQSDKNSKYIIVRGKSETPMCELYPSNGIFSNIDVPHISRSRRKKYEHVWKVRKNVIRRGYS